jgi:DNA-binding MarR family transcriptional regulator
MRGADCLTAALVACTASAGLNEARYRVLSALSGIRTGESSQSELAGVLLQSESNLSTLLERMSADGLITRARSVSDRRRSLIQMTPAGREALARADDARSAAIAHLMREFPPEQAEHLALGLQRLVGELERSLESGVRRATGLDPAFNSAVSARTTGVSPL